MNPRRSALAACSVLFLTSTLAGQELADWPIGTRLYFEGKISITTRKTGPAEVQPVPLQAQLLVVNSQGQDSKRFIWVFSPGSATNQVHLRIAPTIVRLRRASGEPRFTVEIDDEAPDPLAFDVAQEWPPPFPLFAALKAPLTATEFADSSPQNFNPFVARLPRQLQVTPMETAREHSRIKITARASRKLPWRLQNARAGTAASAIPRLTAYEEEWLVDLASGRLESYRKYFSHEQTDPPGHRTLDYELREVSREVLTTDRLGEVEKALLRIGRAETRLRLGAEPLETKQKTIAELRPELMLLGLESHTAYLEDEVRRRQVARAEENKNLELIGKLSPDFTLKDLQGQDVALSSFRGKPVLLVFWGVG